jgi:hypothetical protein
VKNRQAIGISLSVIMVIVFGVFIYQVGRNAGFDTFQSALLAQVAAIFMTLILIYFQLSMPKT